MLNIIDLYKEDNNIVLKDINIKIEEGRTISIECSDDISNLLFDLILGRKISAKGEVYIKEIKISDYLKKNRGKIGVILKEDALYDNMSIKDYIKFYSEIIYTGVDYKEILYKLALLDIENTKIKNLNFSQKRRVSFARERLKEPKLLLFQEPILNLNRDAAKIISDNINEMCKNGTSVLVTSVSFKNAIIMGDRAYRIDADKMTEINDVEEKINEKETSIEMNKVLKIEKIPAKVEDKLLLFDPTEIDYVESEEGISFLYIRGEKFPCSISLTDLEERLKYFGFFRCHRSYLINLQRVREVITWSRNSYSLCLGDKLKSTVPLSKGRLEELKSILKL
jgi:ABC-2 type transport system ATP-binding protein